MKPNILPWYKCVKLRMRTGTEVKNQHESAVQYPEILGIDTTLTVAVPVLEHIYIYTW